MRDSLTSRTPISDESAISGIQSESGSPRTVVNKSANEMKSGMTEAPAPHPEPSRLVWPPAAEDLKRLYIDEKLSAAKIAERYGLDKKFARLKSAESTILD